MKSQSTRTLSLNPQLAFTLLELMVATGLASIVFLMIMTVYIFGLRSFAAMSNYAELTGKSRISLDIMSQDIRQATKVLSFTTNASAKSLTVATYDGTIKYSWDSTSRALTSTKTVAGVTTIRTNLTGCDQWDFSLYQRTPNSMYVFNPTTDLKLCKLIEMTWKCSRTILGKKVNTEEIVTAQIVLRNMNVVISN
jgi:hypothetical protein